MPDTLTVLAETLRVSADTVAGIVHSWARVMDWWTSPYMLPVVLLFLRFTVKYTVDRTVDIRSLTHALADLTTDTFFLALSLFAAYAILPACASQGLRWFIVVLAMAIWGRIFSKRAIARFESSKWIKALIYWMLGFVPALWSLVNAISLLSEKS